MVIVTSSKCGLRLQFEVKHMLTLTQQPLQGQPETQLRQQALGQHINVSMDLRVQMVNC